MNSIVQALLSATTRPQAAEILSDLNLRQLREVAQHLDVYIGTATKQVLSQRIEDATVGAKLRFNATSNLAKADISIPDQDQLQKLPLSREDIEFLQDTYLRIKGGVVHGVDTERFKRVIGRLDSNAVYARSSAVKNAWQSISTRRRSLEDYKLLWVYLDRIVRSHLD